MELDCPRCTIGKLEEIEIDTILIDRCKTCGGLWFDSGELTQMIGDESVKDVESHIPSEEAEIVCPRCVDIKMRRQQLCQPGDADVDIFRCPSCLGSWIDRGVLRMSEDQYIAQNTKHCFSEIFKK